MVEIFTLIVSRTGTLLIQHYYLLDDPCAIDRNIDRLENKRKCCSDHKDFH